MAGTLSSRADESGDTFIVIPADQWSLLKEPIAECIAAIDSPQVMHKLGVAGGCCIGIVIVAQKIGIALKPPMLKVLNELLPKRLAENIKGVKGALPMGRRAAIAFTQRMIADAERKGTLATDKKLIHMRALQVALKDEVDGKLAFIDGQVSIMSEALVKLKTASEANTIAAKLEVSSLL